MYRCEAILWLSPFSPPGCHCNIHWIQFHDTDRLQSRWCVFSTQPTPCLNPYLLQLWLIFVFVRLLVSRLCSWFSDDVFCISFSPILPSCLHPASSCFACKSACAGSLYKILRCLHRLAIWERNLVISIIAVAAWLMNIAFYIHSAVFPRVTKILLLKY